MLLALIADVHENVEALHAILEQVNLAGADEIIFLGDFADPGIRIEETAALLAGAGAAGVWGNHEFGLCAAASSDSLRQCYSQTAQEWMLGLQPYLIRGETRFSHVEPWLDATKVENLWHFDGVPQSTEQLSRSFEAVPERVLFCGHFHRWQIATPAGVVSWDSETPFKLSIQRYFILLAPAFDGYFALFDTQSCILTPCRVNF